LRRSTNTEAIPTKRRENTLCTVKVKEMIRDEIANIYGDNFLELSTIKYRASGKRTKNQHSARFPRTNISIANHKEDAYVIPPITLGRNPKNSLRNKNIEVKDSIRLKKKENFNAIGIGRPIRCNPVVTQYENGA